MNEGNSRGVNVDLNMLNKPGTFLSAHALALYNWLKSPQGLDDGDVGEWGGALERALQRLFIAIPARAFGKPPPGNGMISPPQKVFAEYLLKVNFSEKVRYDRVDQLVSVITNFL